MRTIFIAIFLIVGAFHLHGDSPTERYLSTHPINHIKPYMKQLGVTEEHVYVLKDAISNESEGFFGYHGTTREFRIYQDIIRFALEEVLGITIRKDFHFLRIPGDPALDLLSAKDYLNRYESDTLPDDVNESRFYVSINIAIYENFYFPELCSITGFMKAVNHNMFEKNLVPFFKKLGLDPKHIKTAFEIARSKIQNKGVLLQFFDTSHFQLVDEFAYCSLFNGSPYLNGKNPSQFILNPQQTAFPHLRLVINNYDILNPNSSLKIKRYDLDNEYVRKAYEDALRKYLKSLPVNKTNAEEYKAELRSLWGTL